MLTECTIKAAVDDLLDGAAPPAAKPPQEKRQSASGGRTNRSDINLSGTSAPYSEARHGRIRRSGSSRIAY